MKGNSPFRLSLRSSGVLLHPTSLPGPFGSGDLGPQAFEFVDFLADARQGWWQMLPTNPPHPSGSPYSSDSAFAGSPLLISLERLVEDGLLSRKDLRPPAGLSAERVAYPRVTAFREQCLRRAFLNLFSSKAGPAYSSASHEYAGAAGNWLADYAIYQCLRQRHRNRPWNQWPAEHRRRSAELLAVLDQQRDEYLYQCFVQYVYDRQWRALREHAHRRGVGLIGDIPIFVAHDSADVWSHPALFDLDEQGRPRTVSGVPPDYFSRNGQLWGHPLYAWPEHLRTRFHWWITRFERIQQHFDAVRIDHFLGLARLWAVPGRAKTARHGAWRPSPGRELLTAVTQALGRVEIIAEDLGEPNPAAVELRDHFRLPGMRVLQFAFDDEAGRVNRPYSYPPHCVVYTGTHDNNTTVGWFKAAQKPVQRRALAYCGASDGRDIHWQMIRQALGSVAQTAIIPAQDLLGLDAKSRMNLPSKATGNWQWRLKPGQLTGALATRLAELTDLTGRIRPAEAGQAQSPTASPAAPRARRSAKARA